MVRFREVEQIANFSASPVMLFLSPLVAYTIPPCLRICIALSIISYYSAQVVEFPYLIMTSWCVIHYFANHHSFYLLKICTVFSATCMLLINPGQFFNSLESSHYTSKINLMRKHTFIILQILKKKETKSYLSIKIVS